MRPIKLVMSAFGSYGGVEIIEFNKMQNGLFLIAGDTGSGKSTIFDAVMFALYDTMSGKERKSIMMRSEYASEDRETFVEFTFSYGEGSDVYTVKRYPAYERRSKRRNKDGKYNIIRQQGKVELTMPDGVQFNGKIIQINEKIEEIVGLTAEQFNKIALIAQGEFQELVMDKTGRRKEIFRQIFSTQVYGDIEDAIFKKYKLEVAKLKDNSIKLGELFNTTDILEDSPYRQNWKEAFEKKDTEPEGLVSVLQAELVRLEEIYNSKCDVYKEKEREYNDLNKLITRGREKNKLIDKLEVLKAKKEKLDRLKEEIDNKETLLELAGKAAQVSFAEKNYINRKKDYDSALAKLEKLKLDENNLKKQYDEADRDYKQTDREYSSLMPEYITKRDRFKQAILKYQVVEEKEEELKEYDANLKKTVSNMTKETKKLEKIREDIAVSENILKSYENLNLSMEWVKSEQKQYEEEYLLLDKFKNRLQVCKDKNKFLEAVEKELLLSVETWEKSRRKHEDYNRMYIACQSAFLAERLVLEEPCPVCGSTSHPYPAQMPKDAVTADMVKRALTKEKKCEEHKDTIQKEVENLQSALAADKAVLDEYAAQLFDNKYTLASVNSLIEEKETSLSAKKNNVLEKIKELETKVSDRELKQKELEKLTKRQNKIVSGIESIEQEMHKLEIRTEGLKKEIETLKTSLGYDTKEEQEKNLKECETQLNILEKSHKDADAAFKKVQKKLTSVQGALKEAEKQTEEYLCSLEELLKVFENTFKENGFKSVSDYKNAIIDTKIMKAMEDEIKAYKENCIKAHTGIQTILEQLDNTSKIELAELERELGDINTNMSDIKSEIDRYNFCIQSNNKTVERVNILMQERTYIAERLKVVKSLNEVANGKVHFQTYIQRQYFKQIIQAANTRLIGMASGKFLLKCRDIGTGGQGEMGLELDVYNPLTGKSRDAHTLSGGETFMASLSMALGMADIVQNAVGKTKLNTMFIDEGFGSLSDDVRNNAVKVLLELAGNNRLVGVISHVSELKEQIPNKLVVTKGNNGSSVKWEE